MALGMNNVDTVCIILYLSDILWRSIYQSASYMATQTMILSDIMMKRFPIQEICCSNNASLFVCLYVYVSVSVCLCESIIMSMCLFVFACVCVCPSLSV